MQSFFIAVFVIFLISFQHQGNATRYLPMIVWDHMNPMLSCKCNWFHDVVKLEVYDRFEFVCPTELISVRLLDSYSRPPDQMNDNIFMRKWKGGMKDLDGLKAAMANGSFCDVDHADTTKLFTCLDGKDGQGKAVRISKDEGFYKNDLVVFFNNGDDGRKSTLTRKDKICTMAFVAIVTWNVAHIYDFTYEKFLDYTKKEECKNISTTCSQPIPCPTCPNCTALQTTPPATTTSINQYSTNKTYYTNQTTTEQTTTNQTSIGNNSTNPPTKSTLNPTTQGSTSQSTSSSRTINNEIPTRNSSTTGESKKSGRGPPEEDDWDTFTYGFLAGMGAMLFIAIVSGLALHFLFCRGSKKKSRTSCICQYKAGNQVCQSTIVNDLQLRSENEAKELPKKSRPKSDQGINNVGFHGTLKRDSVII